MRIDDDDRYRREDGRRERDSDASSGQHYEDPRATPRRRESLIERRMAGRDIADEYYEDEEHYRSSPSIYIPAQRSAGTGCAGTALYVLLGVLAIVLLLAIVGKQLFSGMMNAIPQSVSQVVATPTPTLIDRGGTIQQIRSLNRLETQSFSVERVVEASVQRGNVLDMLLGERLLLIASGTVIAGVDMSKLSTDAVIISDDGETITLTLPPTEIFLATLDNTRTRVYDHETGLITRVMGSNDPTLETQARQAAESEVLKAACEGGVMQKAADDARQSLEQFLRALKFERVNISAPAGECVAPATVPTVPTQTP